MKTLKIYHHFVDAQIMKRLNEIGFDNYYFMIESGCASFQIKYLLNGKYEFQTQFDVIDGKITKDTEYYGTNIETNRTDIFKIVSRPEEKAHKDLQQLFDEWLDKYEKWLFENEQSTKDIEDTENYLRQQ